MNKTVVKLLSIPAGFLTANFAEWAFHKYVLHGLGKNKKSIWNFHWDNHHKVSRKNKMIDAEYHGSAKELVTAKEVIALSVGSLSLIPLAFKLPFFVATMWTCGAAYYVIHRQSHMNETWAKRYVPWHYQHHMNKKQDANWNVTLPIFDYVFGTREEQK